VNNFSIDQLSKIALALVMNNRPINPKLTEALFAAILTKITKAKSIDAFYLSMAIGRGLNKKFNAKNITNFSDLCYNLYLVTAKEIGEFDLFQLAQISNFMSSPEVTQAIPDEFWTENLEPMLEEHLGNFVKFKDQLDRKIYLSDFIKSLVGFGIREISTPLFLAKVERVIQPHVSELDHKAIENLLFFVMRTGA